MSNLLRRLRKLEAELTDHCGMVPHSAAWMDYWMREIEQYVAVENSVPKQPFPLDAVRSWMRAQPDST